VQPALPPAIAAPSLPNVVNPPPDEDIPSPPAGFVAPSPHDFLGHRPTSREIAAATTVIGNLASDSDYVATFGTTVPSAAAIASALQLGIEWLGMRDSTEAWDAYVKAQYGMAWKNALMLLDQLKPVFLGAIERNATLASKYQGLTEMFDAAKVVATRSKNAKAKAAATTAAAAAPVVQAAVAVPVATPAAATETVTVTA